MRQGLRFESFIIEFTSIMMKCPKARGIGLSISVRFDGEIGLSGGVQLRLLYRFTVLRVYLGYGPYLLAFGMGIAFTTDPLCLCAFLLQRAMVFGDSTP
jgi:hypothetical protein